jgi:indoleamine 2,3-dioxygenase
MLQNMHSTFRFRHQHWGMVRKYIIDNTKYPRATGGTPITTWLPNQIGACLEQCQVYMQQIDSSQLSADQKVTYDKISQDIEVQIKKIFSEVDSLQGDF